MVDSNFLTTHHSAERRSEKTAINPGHCGLNINAVPLTFVHANLLLVNKYISFKWYKNISVCAFGTLSKDRSEIAALCKVFICIIDG